MVVIPLQTFFLAEFGQICLYISLITLGPFNCADRLPTMPDEIYVGRPSKWGNPFKLSNNSRHSAINKFKNFFKNSQLKNDIDELVGYKLFCHCSPKPCHADYLIEKSNKIIIK